MGQWTSLVLSSVLRDLSVFCANFREEVEEEVYRQYSSAKKELRQGGDPRLSSCCQTAQEGVGQVDSDATTCVWGPAVPAQNASSVLTAPRLLLCIPVSHMWGNRGRDATTWHRGHRVWTGLSLPRPMHQALGCVGAL